MHGVNHYFMPGGQQKIRDHSILTARRWGQGNVVIGELLRFLIVRRGIRKILNKF